jgi:predicted ester cyclase
MKEHVSGWRMSFPDLRFNIEQIIAERDRVVSQRTNGRQASGNVDGNFCQGKSLHIRMITIYRFANRKIAEDWILLESLGLFQQLGVFPGTAELVLNLLSVPFRLLLT